MKLNYVTFSLLALAAIVGVGFSQEPPDYPHGNFDGDCSQCHIAGSWSPAVVGDGFNHAKISGFALQHSHSRADCTACHASLDFSATDPDCATCHADIHRNELGADCSRCHSTRNFIDPSKMANSHLATRFPLRGTHRTVDCEECHSPGGAGNLQWVNTAVDCESCHLDNYLATTNPEHVAGNFPRVCEQCHSATHWIPAGFNHSTFSQGMQCSECHLENYQATVNPDHQLLGFSQSCEVCHGTRSWIPATADGFNHDGLFFPIYSGKHKGKWSVCADCHTTPSNFSQFSCIDCHEHDNPSELADKHSGESGYVYESQACLSCHPQGTE